MSNESITELSEWNALQAHYEDVKDISILSLFEGSENRFDHFHSALDGLVLCLPRARPDNDGWPVDYADVVVFDGDASQGAQQSGEAAVADLVAEVDLSLGPTVAYLPKSVAARAASKDHGFSIADLMGLRCHLSGQQCIEAFL